MAFLLAAIANLAPVRRTAHGSVADHDLVTDRRAGRRKAVSAEDISVRKNNWTESLLTLTCGSVLRSGST